MSCLKQTLDKSVTDILYSIKIKTKNVEAIRRRQSKVYRFEEEKKRESFLLWEEERNMTGVAGPNQKSFLWKMKETKTSILGNS
jgi:hypothetical protein